MRRHMTHLPVDLAVAPAPAEIATTGTDVTIGSSLRSAIAKSGGFKGDGQPGEQPAIFTGQPRLHAQAACMVFFLMEICETGLWQRILQAPSEGGG